MIHLGTKSPIIVTSQSSNRHPRYPEVYHSFREKPWFEPRIFRGVSLPSRKEDAIFVPWISEQDWDVSIGRGRFQQGFHSLRGKECRLATGFSLSSREANPPKQTFHNFPKKSHPTKVS